MIFFLGDYPDAVQYSLGLSGSIGGIMELRKLCLARESMQEK